MRTFIKSLIAVAVLIVIGQPQAMAASSWSCDGPSYVCGSASKPVTSSKSTEAREPKAQRAAKIAKSKSKQSVARANIDDDAKPARRQRTKQTAARAPNDEDAAPARRQRAARSEPRSSGGTTLTGQASYYWQPQALASGGRFNPDAYTAAHKTLPFGTRVRVTNKNNGQTVDVVINDRGPYIGGRIIDLSRAAAGAINMKNSGVVPVSVQVLGRG
jgi:rare lipoprotein A